MPFEVLIGIFTEQQNTETKLEQNHITYLIRTKEAENKHQQLDDCHLVQKVTDKEENVNSELKEQLCTT